MKTRFRRLSAFALVFVFPSTAIAQAVLRGVVLADSGSSPVSGAVVEIAQLKRSALTDTAGAFLLADLPLGRHRVQTRRLGYEPSTQDLLIESADTARVVLRMKVVPVALSAISVSDVNPEVYNPRMVGFADRRRMGNGKFLGPAELRDLQHTNLDNVLRQLGIPVRLVNCNDFRPCGYPYAQGRRGPSSLIRGNCAVKVVLDGVAASQRGPFDLSTVRVLTLAGLEFYAGGAETPVMWDRADRGEASCGVLVLWTRIAEPRK
ncbi:MAG: carboxypeptidase-like regulatory domain-containing protein [Gemmatimonadaceae bacterium]